MDLKNVVTQFGPMSGFEVIKQLVKLFGADVVRQAVDEIDGGRVLGHQIVIGDILPRHYVGGF